jgi:hypothetical protein
METKNMDYTPEAWDKEFEDFRSAVGQPVSKPTLLVCVHCDWIGDISYLEDESEPECPKCGHAVHFEDGGIEPEDDCPLDGDFDSTMESIGWGYDEQYEHNDCYSGDY